MTQLNISGPANAATLPGAQPAAPQQAVRAVRKALPPDARGWWWGTGRRKSAVARVRMRPSKAEGKGEIRVQITGKSFKDIETYFSEQRDRLDCVAPLRVCGLQGRMDVVVRLRGGGTMGQAQAVRLGIARALRDYDPNLETPLRDAGFLTRDPREVERKKYGLAGARRRFQFSKR